MKERMTAYFSGTVQGVGFRYHTQHLASGFDVQGFVRNLSDGRVEVVAEGETSELDSFLQSIRESRLGRNIDQFTQKRNKATDEFSGFVIEH